MKKTYGRCALDDIAAVVSVAGLKTEPLAGLFGLAQLLLEAVVVNDRRSGRAAYIYGPITTRMMTFWHELSFRV